MTNKAHEIKLIEGCSWLQYLAENKIEMAKRIFFLAFCFSNGLWSKCFGYSDLLSKNDCRRKKNHMLYKSWQKILQQTELLTGVK